MLYSCQNVAQRLVQTKLFSIIKDEILGELIGLDWLEY